MDSSSVQEEEESPRFLNLTQLKKEKIYINVFCGSKNDEKFKNLLGTKKSYTYYLLSYLHTKCSSTLPLASSTFQCWIIIIFYLEDSMSQKKKIQKLIYWKISRKFSFFEGNKIMFFENFNHFLKNNMIRASVEASCQGRQLKTSYSLVVGTLLTYLLVRSWQLLLVWSLDYAFILWQDWCPISQSSSSSSSSNNSRQIYKCWQVRIIGK